MRISESAPIPLSVGRMSINARLLYALKPDCVSVMPEIVTAFSILFPSLRYEGTGLPSFVNLDPITMSDFALSNRFQESGNLAWILLRISVYGHHRFRTMRSCGKEESS